MNSSHSPGLSSLNTHEVTNQSPPLQSYDALEQDVALRKMLPAQLALPQRQALQTLGRAVGDEEWIVKGFQANEHPPALRSFDRQGRRIDQVDFHPAWHALMSLGMQQGVHSTAWTASYHGHLTHAALQYLLTQLEPGVCCPLAMTYAAIPVLRAYPSPMSSLASLATVAEYDARFIPAESKRSVTLGMAMTEKQGGSDVRTNCSSAIAESGSAREYRLRGHKWFCSAPMSDAFLTLAQAPNGLSCFLVPRFCPDGSLNRIFIQRLKNKLGNRSNASAEIEYDNTWSVRLGEEGAGIQTIIEMVQHTRLDAAAAPAGLMRQALAQAIHHARHRSAFGRPLITQPLMLSVLADLAIESEAATLLIMRVAQAFDAAAGNEIERAFARLGTIVAKFWVNKQTPQFTYEAMECLGGSGYIEECVLPRLYREAPVNSIWEGSGNVMCLDLLRVLERSPETLQGFDTLVTGTHGNHPALLIQQQRMHQEIVACRSDPARARRALEIMAKLLQGCLLLEKSDAEVFEAFVASRLGDAHYRCFGTLDGAARCEHIVQRAWPA